MPPPVELAPPLVEELVPAPDPVEAFLALSDLPHVIFLDSAARGEPLGRYSYISARPFEIVVSRGGFARVLEERSPRLEERGYAPATEDVRESDSPLGLLEARLRRFRAAKVADLPPFQGGAAGLFGYGLSRTIERLPPPRHDEFSLPDLAVGLYDWVLAFDHTLGTCHLVSCGAPAGSARARERRARARSGEVRARLRQRGRSTRAPRPHPAMAPASRLAPRELAPSWPLPGGGELSSNFRREDYLAAVERAIELIGAGDIFQVNLSQRLLHPARSRPADFYLRLRSRNAAPFAGYLDLGDAVVASSSPEQFLSVEDGLVVTRPIKGTRSRGYTPEEDSYRRVDLRMSEKDRAENVMIVDLLRNDLSRVCRPGTVCVPALFELERHPTVHHLVSEVRGLLREGQTAPDLLRASFPGGSVTGAPKVRAMEIIAELEPTARGAYCGSLGWIGFDGSMVTSILIRTATIARGWIQLPVGGGIVADSRPGDEYRETLDKARGMLRAL